MRKLIYFVACTADRFIAAADGSIDRFLHGGDYIADIVATFPETIPAHLRQPLGATGEGSTFDAVVMGRGTYEPGPKAGVVSPYSHLRQYVVSRTMTSSPAPDIELVRDDPVGRVRQLKAEPGKAIWLCGGGGLAAALFGEIDELILKVHPVVLGGGIPLFAGAVGPARMELLDCKPYAIGVVRMRYRVIR